MTESDAMAPTDRLIHRRLLEGVIATGVVPSHEELARSAGVPLAAVPRHLAALSAADYLGLDAQGRIACLYPFSPSPTPHNVVINGQHRSAMCSIDALGMAAMLNHDVEIESVCAECAAPIRLRVGPGVVTHAEPAESVVLARRSGDEPACETCCPFTLFACTPEHGARLAARLPETAVVPLDEALRHAEIIFSDFLAEEIPAKRRRSELVASRLRA